MAPIVLRIAGDGRRWKVQMKRSGQVGLVVMGAAAFAATFASVHAFQSRPAAMAQRPSPDCTPRQDLARQDLARQDGTQNCQPVQRSFAHYLIPSYFHGGSSIGSAQSASVRGAALTNSSRTAMPATSTGVVRSGFGATAGSGSFRVSAGG